MWGPKQPCMCRLHANKNNNHIICAIIKLCNLLKLLAYHILLPLWLEQKLLHTVNAKEIWNFLVPPSTPDAVVALLHVCFSLCTYVEKKIWIPIWPFWQQSQSKRLDMNRIYANQQVVCKYKKIWFGLITLQWKKIDLSHFEAKK